MKEFMAAVLLALASWSVSAQTIVYETHFQTAGSDCPPAGETLVGWMPSAQSVACTTAGIIYPLPEYTDVVEVFPLEGRSTFLVLDPKHGDTSPATLTRQFALAAGEYMIELKDWMLTVWDPLATTDWVGVQIRDQLHLLTQSPSVIGWTGWQTSRFAFSVAPGDAPINVSLIAALNNGDGDLVVSTLSITSVPEPETPALFLLGVAVLGVGTISRRRN